jgi:hypothetical protein
MPTGSGPLVLASPSRPSAVYTLDQPYTRGERSRLPVTFLSGVAKKLQERRAHIMISRLRLWA